MGDARAAANELARVVRCFSAHRVGCVLCKVQRSVLPRTRDATSATGEKKYPAPE